MSECPGRHVAVVVIGSGPVGLTLANLLGVAEVGTLVVERNATTVQEPRAVSIDDESLRTLQAAGLVDVVLPTVVPGYGSHYLSPDRSCFAVVEPSGRPYGYPRRNAFRQPVLEAQLKAGLGRFGHVAALYGWRLDRYVAEADRVAVHLVGPDGAMRSLTCDYLVGCDGASSRVREQQGVHLEGSTFDERWLIVDLENNGNATPHTEVFCDTRRPCITLPGPDGTRRFEFKLLPGETDADLLAPDRVAELIAGHGADPAARIRRVVVYRFHARVAPRWRFGRVLLAGDAAHLTPPFAGQGMNSGMRDAHNLAWKLAAVLDGRAGPGLLDSYERERKPHIWAMIRLALRMGRIMSPKTRTHGAVVQSLFRALKLWPAAADYVAQMKYKPKPHFAEGFLVPDGAGRHGLVGRMLPQPRVAVGAAGEGATVLLDEALGPGFALLAHGADAGPRLAALHHPVWDRLDVRRVAVLPAGAEATPDASGITAVVDVEDALAAPLARFPGHALLLRPDHYVAALIPFADPGPATRAVETLIAESWGAGDAPPAPGHI